MPTTSRTPPDPPTVTEHDLWLSDVVASAEAGGDAATALALIERDRAYRGDTSLVWHPERVATLTQRVLLDGFLPAWSTSRWVLAQAARSSHPGSRDRALTAVELVGEAIGGRVASYLTGADPEARLLMTEHDWAWRQVMLYELGGLRSFLDEVAAPELVEACERIADWRGVPMGGFQLVVSRPRTLSWLDLGSGRTVETDNLGAAVLLVPGDHVVGRLAPTGDRPVFEAAPLAVTAAAARQVAADPGEWLDAVVVDSRRPTRLGDALVTAVPAHRPCTDVPRAVVYAVAHDAALVSGGRPCHACGPVAMRQHCIDLVRLALNSPDLLDELDFDLDPWPVVAAVLLEASVLVELAAVRADLETWTRLGRRLAGPAAQLCLRLGAGVSTAA